MLYNAFCRIFQFGFRIGCYALPWRKPFIFRGENSFAELARTLGEKGVGSTLLVTDAAIVSLGLHQALLDELAKSAISVTIYDKTIANPTIDNIEQALELYNANNCRCIIAFGGGSPMDCAKGVGVRVAHPNKRIPKFRGQLKVLKRLPLLVAVPTTSGTGSETTLAAVISDSITHEKYAINDPALIPRYAVLNPELTRGLPPHITSTTGMDALVHAVEAFIGGSNTKQTREDALAATKLIFENVFEAYQNGDNIAARANMQEAAFLAGAAFTRAYVGNVHAVAHTLGGMYGVPHGLANAVIMPYVLDAYGAAAYKQLAQLADAAKVGEPGMTTEQKAKAFIRAVRELNQKMGIGTKIPALNESDIPLLEKRARREANPLYPVPVIFDTRAMSAIYYCILDKDVKKKSKPDINRQLCSACSICVDICPADCLFISAPAFTGDINVHAQLSPEKCTGCGMCEKHCPMRAITMKAGLVL